MNMMKCISLFVFAALINFLNDSISIEESAERIMLSLTNLGPKAGVVRKLLDSYNKYQSGGGLNFELGTNVRPEVSTTTL